jgi:two-component system LytT family response regulator
MVMTIRTIVVDDEPLGRERIVSLLEAEPDVHVAAECGDGRAAIAAIRREAPHLVFLDVQMPEQDGFSVMEAVGGERLPLVVFVTAHDSYALRAFEVRALDYLLKPFDQERFRQSLQRVRTELAHMETDALARRVLELASTYRGERHVQGDRLVVKSAGRVSFLKTREIDWIEAAGNYLKLHVGAEAHLIRQTMAVIEEQLDPAVFVRIHRSQMVNIDRIKEMHPLFNGEYEVVLRTGARLTLSRGYRERLQARLGGAF